MRYAKEDNFPDPYDIGSSSSDCYLRVNSVGYYEAEYTALPVKKVSRKNGRNDYLICYLQKGDMVFVYENKIHTLKQGFYLNKPHIEDLYWQENEDLFIIYWVHFTGYGVDEVLKTVNLLNGGVYDVGECDEVAQLFKRLIKEISAKKHGYETVTSSLLMMIISLLGRKLYIHDMLKKEDYDPRIDKAVEYIHDHYHESLSIKKLAVLSDLSPSHFARLFKQHTGMYPVQFIINHRLEKACNLMRNTKLSLKEIACAIGFDDQLYFSRLFKKHIGTSPSSFSKLSVDENSFISKA